MQKLQVSVREAHSRHADMRHMCERSQEAVSTAQHREAVLSQQLLSSQVRDNNTFTYTHSRAHTLTHIHTHTHINTHTHGTALRGSPLTAAPVVSGERQIHMFVHTRTRIHTHTYTHTHTHEYTHARHSIANQSSHSSSCRRR